MRPSKGTPAARTWFCYKTKPFILKTAVSKNVLLTVAQLCAINDINAVGAPFDFAMDTMIGLKGPDIEFTFFRGTQAELKDLVGACSSYSSDSIVQIGRECGERKRRGLVAFVNEGSATCFSTRSFSSQDHALSML